METSWGPPPDPSQAADLTDFISLLNDLRLWAGGPSYRTLAKKVGPLLRPPRQLTHTTLADTFQTDRRRLDIDLVLAAVRALGLDEPEVDRWRQAYARVQRRGAPAGDAGSPLRLPADLPTFTGRTSEVERLLAVAGRPARPAPSSSARWRAWAASARPSSPCTPRTPWCGPAATPSSSCT
ncbi:hypothetical protein ACFQ9X_35635 [Catenulispora yoronensis]